MKISTKGLYAVRFMILLAEHDGENPVPLKEIAESTHISRKYLEQITSSLSTAQLVRSSRGAAGGYHLARPPRSISILDVLRVTEGSLAPVSCLNGEFLCDHGTPCYELFVWKELYARMEDYLASVTLQDVLDRSSELAVDSYSI